MSASNLLRAIAQFLARGLPRMPNCCVCGRAASNVYAPWGVATCDGHLVNLVRALGFQTRLRLYRPPLVSLN